MVGVKYHISDDGEARRCRAEKQPCRFGGDGDHYSTKIEARKVVEDKLREKFSEFATVRQSDADPESADNSFQYAKYSLLNDHLHNASAVGSPQELVYYSSRAGRLELERRIAQDRRKDSNYRKIAQVLDDPNFVKPDLEVDEQEYAARVLRGQEVLSSSRSLIHNDVLTGDLDQRNNRRDEERLAGAVLLTHSHEWLKKLSPEEQEAVAFSTSNGYSAIEGSLHEDLSRDTRLSAKPFVRDQIAKIENQGLDYDDEEREIESVIRSKASEYRESFLSAVRKAPVLDSPITLYRGTNGEELRKVLGVDSDAEWGEIVKQLGDGKHDGHAVSDASMMTTLPKSASISYSRSLGFAGRDNEAKEVVFKIQQHSIASPSLVSAWGVGEGEVFTNPNSVYRVDGSTETSDGVLVVNLVEEVSQ